MQPPPAAFCGFSARRPPVRRSGTACRAHGGVEDVINLFQLSVAHAITGGQSGGGADAETHEGASSLKPGQNGTETY